MLLIEASIFHGLMLVIPKKLGLKMLDFFPVHFSEALFPVELFPENFIGVKQVANVADRLKQTCRLFLVDFLELGHFLLLFLIEDQLALVMNQFFLSLSELLHVIRQEIFYLVAFFMLSVDMYLHFTLLSTFILTKYVFDLLSDLSKHIYEFQDNNKSNSNQ
jgi:hypothetical protein